MRIPVVGEKLTCLNGFVYLVEDVDLVEHDYWLVTVVAADGFDEMDSVTEQYDPDEFVGFCDTHGIVYT